MNNKSVGFVSKLCDIILFKGWQVRAVGLWHSLWWLWPSPLNPPLHVTSPSWSSPAVWRQRHSPYSGCACSWSGTLWFSALSAEPSGLSSASSSSTQSWLHPRRKWALSVSGSPSPLHSSSWIATTKDGRSRRSQVWIFGRCLFFWWLVSSVASLRP